MAVLFTGIVRKSQLAQGIGTLFVNTGLLLSSGLFALVLFAFLTK